MTIIIVVIVIVIVIVIIIVIILTMISKEKIQIVDNNKILNKDNKKYPDITAKSNKLYDINEDIFGDINNGFSLNTLKKFKTFKEYKESLEKNIAPLPNSINKKKESAEDKFKNKKISELPKKTLHDSWDKKLTSSKNNLLKDLQNTREQLLKEKHKSYHKLHIPNFGYPNIKKVSRSSSLSKATPKTNDNNQKSSVTDINNGNSNYVESLKKEALSLAKNEKN